MVLKLLFFVVLLAPLSGWGFSSEQVQNYKNQIQTQQLWKDPQWLKLGHYRDGVFGYQSPLEGDFFLSRSSNNPEAELIATVEALFINEASAQEHQCRYLARTRWLKKKLEISSDNLIDCKDRDLWKQQLGASEVYIVFASSDLNSAGSSFGHTFLRLHNTKNAGNLEILDYGINYSAITEKESGALYALKGLFGLYPGAYSMLPYYQKIKEYTNLEGRNLWEYRLDLSAEEVSFLIDHLLELDRSYASYYFANDNCSEQILELLEVVRPESALTSAYRDFVIPLDTLKTLRDKRLLSEESLRQSLQAEWRTRFANLDLAQKESLKQLTKEKTQERLQQLPAKKKAQVLEAATSYLAIKEYRGEGDFKEEKYKLSLQRAALGKVTEPLKIPRPESPLLSADSQRFYLGTGLYNKSNFYSFKYRRAFHDLLSKDSGLSPFSHIEIFSFDFRYFDQTQNLDLYKFIFLNTLSTSPINILDKPISWKLDIGTEPRLSPYLNFGAGYSFDFALGALTRWTWMAVSESDHLADLAQPHVGIESLLMTKTSLGQGYLSLKGLQNTSSGRALYDLSLGLSLDSDFSEYRLEMRARDTLPEIQFSIVF